MIPNLMNFTTNKDEKRCFPIDRPDPFVSWRKEYLCTDIFGNKKYRSVGGNEEKCHMFDR